jgi:hypothetical protein
MTRFLHRCVANWPSRVWDSSNSDIQHVKQVALENLLVLVGCCLDVVSVTLIRHGGITIAILVDNGF